MFHRNVELHRRAEEPLQQGVVQLLRDARSLREPLPELKLQPGPQQPQAPPEACPDEQGRGRGAEKKESSRLIKGGKDGELERRSLLVPDAVVVAGADLKPVVPGREVRIRRGPSPGRAPPVGVVALQPGTEAGAFRDSQAPARRLGLT